MNFQQCFFIQLYNFHKTDSPIYYFNYEYIIFSYEDDCRLMQLWLFPILKQNCNNIFLRQQQTRPTKSFSAAFFITRRCYICLSGNALPPGNDSLYPGIVVIGNVNGHCPSVNKFAKNRCDITNFFEKNFKARNFPRLILYIKLKLLKGKASRRLFPRSPFGNPFYRLIAIRFFCLQ